MADAKEEVDVAKLYGKEATLPKEQFMKEFSVSTEGLNTNTAKENLEKFGLNEITGAKPKKWYHYFLESLLSPFNCILLGIVFILFYTDVYLAEEASYANIIVIAILVSASTLLDFFEEYRSNKAAEKLKELVATTTTVIREGKEMQIPMKEVVLGDIVLLSAGSMIPADLRVLEAKDLYVGQSSLTGESEAVKKSSEPTLSMEEIENIADLETICFMGTNVTSGSEKAVVIKTGDDTYFGKVAHTLSTGKPKTAFQEGIENISRLLIRFMVIIIPIVFLLNAWKHHVILAFTFAVAIAICITPLLLPVILSSSLSKGAVRMSKKKTIVKKLDSIQNFGAMNILCTDKTGTLTKDEIVLEKYLDIKGNEDIRVLKHAFLNSYFQTGLKGNIDEAVIKRGLENGMETFQTKYKKIDEIPFDFSRRRLSVILQDENKKQMITKGAVEEILSICSFVDYQGQVSPITKEIKKQILDISKSLNEDGLRVVAVCQKNEIENITNFDVSAEANMVLMGFIGFLDPPKESAKESILKLNKAGIRVIVLTGDNLEVTRAVCNKVGINSKRIVVGSQIDKLSDIALLRHLKNTNIFAKLSPIQKARIVRLLKTSGNIVGYMGDGINDGPSLLNSDVGVSVDTAVDIAKESADIILLEKDLNVLFDGVTEGRRTFVNLMKYIKMATSFNFGEVLSVMVGSVLLPFLPETPIQLLVEGLLYDFGQMTLPFDNVDEEALQKPKKLDIKGLKRFMFFMGPLSSLFDLLIFAYVWFVFNIHEVAMFQSIWFTYSIISNLLGLYIIRTAKNPWNGSKPSKAIYFSSILIIIISLIIPYTPLGEAIGLVPIGFGIIAVLFMMSFLYCIVASFAKRTYIRKYGEWI